MSILKNVPYGADITFKKTASDCLTSLKARRQAIREAIESNLVKISELCEKLDVSREDYHLAVKSGDNEYIEMVYEQLGLGSSRPVSTIGTRAVGSSAALEAAAPKPLFEQLSARDRQALKGQQKQLNAASLRDLTDEVIDGHAYDRKLGFFERNLVQEDPARVFELTPAEASFFGF